MSAVEKKPWVSHRFPPSWHFTRLPNVMLLDASLSPDAKVLWMLLCHLAVEQRTDQPVVGVEEARSAIGLGERTWAKARDELVERGLLEVKGRRGFGLPNEYVVLPPHDPQNAVMGADKTQELGADESQHPSLFEIEPSSTSTLRAGRAPTQVNGKKVTVKEEFFAIAVLDVFNEITGKKFAAKETLGKIILRHREHPELDVADHRRIIEEQVAHPWWKGDVSPAVIYGNGPLFDRALNGVRAAPADPLKVNYTRV
jgi:hypothetical protein